MAKQLRKGDETHRRWNIIEVSRSGDAQMLPQLLAQLDGNETLENRRHIVRALGNIGGQQVEGKLVQMLECETGLMLGDIAQALGKIKSQRAPPLLKHLADHPEVWVRQNVAFALKQLRSEG